MRVKLALADASEPAETWPQVKAFTVPGMPLGKNAKNAGEFE